MREKEERGRREGGERVEREGGERGREGKERGREGEGSPLYQLTPRDGEQVTREMVDYLDSLEFELDNWYICIWNSLYKTQIIQQVILLTL